MQESYLNQKNAILGQTKLNQRLIEIFLTYKFNGERDHELPLNEYLKIIKLYLQNVIDSLKISDELKTQLSVKTVLRLSKNVRKKLHKNSWSDNKETMISEEADKCIKEIFKSILTSYQD